MNVRGWIKVTFKDVLRARQKKPLTQKERWVKRVLDLLEKLKGNKGVV